MKTTLPSPSPAVRSDIPAIVQLRVEFEEMRDADVIEKRAHAEAAHLQQIASATSDADKKRSYHVDALLKREEGDRAQANKKKAVQNLSATANKAFVEIGPLHGRIDNLLRGCADHVAESARQALSPFFESSQIANAVAICKAVREQQAFSERNRPTPCGFEVENDGAGGGRLREPINALAILNAHDDAVRCMKAIEERIRLLKISLNELGEFRAQPVAVREPRRRAFTPPAEKDAKYRVQLRILDSCSLGRVAGPGTPIVNADAGEIIDLPWLPGENCVALELLSSGRVDIIGKAPAPGKPRVFVPAISGEVMSGTLPQ